MKFLLDERLAGGGFEITRCFDSIILLKNDANFPWFILVPEVTAEIEGLHQLDSNTLQEVLRGVCKISQFIEKHFNCEKLNVACIGNVVRQMHIHIVGRNYDDPAWPGVVWSFDEKKKYASKESDRIIAAAREYLN